MHLDARAVGHHASKVIRSLYQTLHSFAHSNHTVGTSHDCASQSHSAVGSHNLGGSVGLGNIEFDAVVNAFELGFVGCQHLGSQSLESLGISRRNGHNSHSLAGDSIAQTTTVNTCQLQAQLHLCLAHQTEHQLVGICAVEDNLDTRVTTFQTLNLNFVGSRIGRGSDGCVGQRHIGVGTTSATNIEFALGLGVEVEQGATLQPARFQTKCAIHTSLLGCSEECLDCAVSQILGLQHCEDCSRTDTVVGTEGCTISGHPLAIDIGLDGVFLEVKHLVVVLLGHHIEVRLNHHGATILHTCGCGLAYQYVVGLIYLALQTLRCGKVDDVLTNLSLVMRRTRDMCHSLKVTPNALGLQICKFHNCVCYWFIV